ncbi:hypothetical protein AKO1_008087 [Acrasis kona]|uniref:Synapsin n=1 Tax=Acrasis kona TaxID=1008807 RepID=A0AAW2YQB1_9EUKA
MNKKDLVRNLLVIDYNSSTDWYSRFRSVATADGGSIKVEQAGWQHIAMVGNSSKGPLLLLRGNSDGLLQQTKDRHFIPDFLLIRNFPSNLHGSTYRNVLLGLMFCNLPSVNSLSSIFFCSEKPIVYGALKGIQDRLGADQFPLVPQMFYPNIQSCEDFDEVDDETIPGVYPTVVKIGTVHAGFGKMKLNNRSDFDDFRTCASLHNEYYTAEPFLKNTIKDFRLQKIGYHFRLYSRESDSSWKNNWGAMKFKHIEEIPERYISWMNEVSKITPGLDMFALDVLVDKDGNESIIELNDSSMGLLFEKEDEDNNKIRDLVLSRMNQHWGLSNKCV